MKMSGDLVRGVKKKFFLKKASEQAFHKVDVHYAPAGKGLLLIECQP